MNEIIWASIGILATITVLLVIYMRRLSKNGWGHETDYKTFFTMGLIWFPLGLALDMPFFFIMGLAYIAIGLGNRNRW